MFVFVLGLHCPAAVTENMQAKKGDSVPPANIQPLETPRSCLSFPSWQSWPSSLRRQGDALCVTYLENP